MATTARRFRLASASGENRSVQRIVLEESGRSGEIRTPDPLLPKHGQLPRRTRIHGLRPGCARPGSRIVHGKVGIDRSRISGRARRLHRIRSGVRSPHHPPEAAHLLLLTRLALTAATSRMTGATVAAVAGDPVCARCAACSAAAADGAATRSGSAAPRDVGSARAPELSS